MRIIIIDNVYFKARHTTSRVAFSFLTVRGGYICIAYCIGENKCINLSISFFP